MMPCTRGPEPALLARHAEALTTEYVAKRAHDRSHAFRWRTVEQQSLLAAVREALREMTAGHCAYCDHHPLGASGEEQIDHFQPCSRFPELAYHWSNLFFVCMRCNRDKRDRWEPALLRPDVEGFTFERYFTYRSESGELAPNAAAPDEDQARARCTIEILRLNRGDACKARRLTVRVLRAMGPPFDADEIPYRFLLPLCAL